jgi:hypothetical protein
MKRLLHLSLIVIVMMLIFSEEGVAQKTDTIYHVNGNVLTGDLKKLAYGVATWKMDGMGTISLEEVKIRSIKSRKQFEVKLKDGAIYFGTIDTSDIGRSVYLVLKDERKWVKIEDIVELYPIKRNFWARTSGNFSLGINTSKGSDASSLASAGGLSYRKKKSYINLAWDNNLSFQGDTINSTKLDGTMALQRLFKKGWSSQVLLGIGQNSELGTKLRWGLTLIGIKDIVYNSWNRFYAGAGLSGMRETPYDDSGTRYDLAGNMQLVWRVFKYTLPKVWVDAIVSYIPYFTDTGRQRYACNLNPQISIIDDNLKIGFVFYYTFDTKPPSSASSTSDYGFNLQLSFSFH